MIKRGKFYLPPPRDSSNFKELFHWLTESGVGRLVDEDGEPIGSWTPELLANAISEIDANHRGIDVRTVQLWFQDSDKGVSADNIRWLGRVFGCDDPEAAREWQIELRSGQSRLSAKRRGDRNRSKPSDAQEAGEAEIPVKTTQNNDATEPKQGFSLARKTEAFFGSESTMALPLVVFTGACAFALIAFTLDIHSVVFTSESAPSKQIGFLWAPNWTFAHLTILPLFLALLIDLLRCWKEEWRPRLAGFCDPAFPCLSWEKRVTAASYTFVAVFFVTVIIASGFNWTATYLIPLLKGDPSSWVIDWGRIAIVRHDLISVPSAIVFTGFAFAFNGFAAYFFFSGHIFLHLIKHDYLDLMKGIETKMSHGLIREIEDISFSLMNGIFRCTALGVVITILMKLQSSFLQSSSLNLIDWLVTDFQSPFGTQGTMVRENSSVEGVPGFYYSFFCLLAIVGTFANASVKIRRMLARLHGSKDRSWFFSPWMVMDGTMALLVINYLLIGVLPGFSIFLLFSMVLTVYLLRNRASSWSQGSQ